MQGTVASFDEDLHHGSLLLDDGSAIEFSPEAFGASGLRLVRVGQRVKVERGRAGEVVRITIPTLP